MASRDLQLIAVKLTTRICCDEVKRDEMGSKLPLLHLWRSRLCSLLWKLSYREGRSSVRARTAETSFLVCQVPQDLFEVLPIFLCKDNAVTDAV